MTALLIAEHDNVTLKSATAQALTAALRMTDVVDVLVAGSNGQSVAEQAAKLSGVRTVYYADHPQLADSRKGEDGQGACVAQAMGSARAASVVAARRGRRPAACGGLAQDACCKLCSLGGRGKASALRRRGGGHALACLSRSA